MKVDVQQAGLRTVQITMNEAQARVLYDVIGGIGHDVLRQALSGGAWSDDELNHLRNVSLSPLWEKIGNALVEGHEGDSVGGGRRHSLIRADVQAARDAYRAAR